MIWRSNAYHGRELGLPEGDRVRAKPIINFIERKYRQVWEWMKCLALESIVFGVNDVGLVFHFTPGLGGLLFNSERKNKGWCLKAFCVL